MSALLEVKNLRVRFLSAAPAAYAVHDIGFHIKSGETVGIVGESGSGKSVTAKTILRLLDNVTEVSGSIMFNGDELLKSPIYDRNAQEAAD